MVTHTFNPSTQEAETGRSLCIREQPGLQSKFTEKHCLEKQKRKNPKNDTTTKTLPKQLVLPWLPKAPDPLEQNAVLNAHVRTRTHTHTHTHTRTQLSDAAERTR